ncbi:MAG: lipopolysaccharide heptosyltransferase II [Desulfobacterota bacterium]|nr:lipopolysaccharide heptosyltransferase II [Thermodesulfobacteriota bacterium]
MKVDFDQVRRILVRGVNWVGDTILTYPTVESLKRRFPGAMLSVLVPAPLADLWKNSPYVDEIIPFEKRGGARAVFDDLRIGRSLEKKRFDLALILPRSFRSAFQVYLARVPIRVGYRDEGRSILLTHGIVRKEELLRVHRIFYYHELLRSLGHQEVPSSPSLPLGEEERGWAEEILKGRGGLEGNPLVGLNPGAAYGSAKCWSPERFGELGRRLARARKAKVIIFGSESERRIGRRILDHLGNDGIDLTGRTNLLQLAALLERCAFLLTNDTGTMHVATAVGTPVVAIFGPTDPSATGPWGEGHVVVKKEVSCSPCFKRVCPTDHRCMEQITVEEVEEVIDKGWETFSNRRISRPEHPLSAHCQSPLVP